LWYNIATIHFETGEDELAIQMYKETLRVERKSLGKEHPDVVLTLQHLGQVHQQLGQTEQSIKYFKEAAGIEKRLGKSGNLSLARIQNLLGNVYLQLGMTTEMMECYVEASQIYQTNRASGATLVIGGYTFYGLSKTNPPCAPTA
jgi:tetratricopeptide (TPR) repeat protein